MEILSGFVQEEDSDADTDSIHRRNFVYDGRAPKLMLL
jgi:hypothetical protein